MKERRYGDIEEERVFAQFKGPKGILRLVKPRIEKWYEQSWSERQIDDYCHAIRAFMEHNNAD